MAAAYYSVPFPLMLHKDSWRLPGEHTCNGKVQRVFLTGVSGMVGSQVMKFLLRSPCRVVYGLVCWRSNLIHLAGYLAHPRLKLIKGDITNAFRIQEFVELSMPHYVYHFPAL